MKKDKRQFQVIADWPEFKKYMLLLFDENYKAWYFVNYMIGEDSPVKWLSDKKLITSDGIELTSDDLEELVEFEPDKGHLQWKPTAPYDKWYFNFKNKHRQTGNAPNGVSMVEKTTTATSQGDQARKPSPKRERVPRPSKEGLTTIGQIAERMKMTPQEARGILRDTNTPKPDAGWAWPEDKTPAIEKILKEHRKQ